MYLWGIYRLLSVYRTFSRLSYVMVFFGMFTDSSIFTGRCQHYAISCMFGVFTDSSVFTGRCQNDAMSCFVGCFQIVQYLQDVISILLCHVFVGYFQIVQYLRDVVTATQSMSTVNASITTMGYSSEGREINVLKVREPPRMNRSIFKHVICNG